MKHLLFAIALFISTGLFAQQGEKNFIDQNYIEVTGKAEMEITPDMIYIKVLLNEKDFKNKISVSEMEQKMFQKLRETGVNIDKNVKVKDIASDFRTKLLGKDVVLSKEYQILVHDGKTAARVFLEMEQLNISNINVEKLDNSKMDEYRREVKIKAIKVAKDKAKTLANAIGQDAGRALYISELQQTYFPAQSNLSNVVVTAYGVKDRAQKDFVPDTEFQNLKIDATILCRFELK